MTSEVTKPGLYLRLAAQIESDYTKARTVGHLTFAEWEGRVREKLDAGVSTLEGVSYSEAVDAVLRELITADPLPAPPAEKPPWPSLRQLVRGVTRPGGRPRQWPATCASDGRVVPACLPDDCTACAEAEAHAIRRATGMVRLP